VINTPNFHITPPASGGKGRGEKGKDPQGLVDTPHVPNAEKYPA